MCLRSHIRRRVKSKRCGASTVEFAVVAPIVFLILLAVMQFAGLLMSQNVLTSAARTGGRMASLPGTDSSSAVIAAVHAELQRGGIDPDDVSVNVTPSTLIDLEPGDEINVTVSAPISDLGWIWVIAPPDANLVAEISYQRE